MINKEASDYIQNKYVEKRKVYNLIFRNLTTINSQGATTLLLGHCWVSSG